MGCGSPNGVLRRVAFDTGGIAQNVHGVGRGGRIDRGRLSGLGFGGINAGCSEAAKDNGDENPEDGERLTLEVRPTSGRLMR